MSLDRYPINPRYGNGVFRRRVRLVGEAGRVTAVLNDDFHAMWCQFEHDGRVVVGVDAGLIRFPKSTCPGAALALRELVGLSLGSARRQVMGDGRTSRNCTHLLDLALLAQNHALLGNVGRVIDIVIPDETDGTQQIDGFADNQLIHSWRVGNGVILEPGHLAGRPIFSGFVRWAETMFSGLALDVARMMQKGAFVARGRRYIVDQRPGMRTSDESDRLGNCYSFSPPHIWVGSNNTNYVRDFTDGIIEVVPDRLT